MIIDTMTIVFTAIGVGIAVWMLWNHDKFVTTDETENIIHHHARQPYHPDHEE